MGLEGVEIAVEAEDEFGIVIRDEDFERIRTVGDFEDIILERIRDRHADDDAVARWGSCPCPHFFCKLRRQLAEVCATPRGQVRPATLMADLVPETHRRSRWATLASLLGTRFPALKGPASVELAWRALLFGAFALSFVAAAACAAAAGLSAGLLSTLLAAVALIYTLPFAAERVERRRTLIPAGLTVGAVVQQLVEQHEQESRKRAVERIDDVHDRFRRIVSDVLDVPLDQVTTDARFVEDLNCG